MKKDKCTGSAGFELYYSSLFGARWNELKSSLLAPVKQIEYKENLLKPYYLDYASVQAAKAIPEMHGGKWLDMCAAPGGKTLILCNKMQQTGTIIANEISAQRRNRLIKVLNEHLPFELRQKVRVTGFDACRLPRFEKEEYDRILLDAPCSSERHVLQNEKYLNLWTLARIKNLAQRQWALLSAAFLLLKKGGFLVYSTCAVNCTENDSVISKLIEKYGNAAAPVLYSSPLLAEKTVYGYMFLPDKADGAGPIYFSLIQKI